MVEPGPSRSDLLELLQLASLAPDHGRLSPWRMAVVGGSQRARLGECLESVVDTGTTARRAIRSKPLLAPVLVAPIFSPVGSSRIPEWEQLAATVCVVNNLMLLLEDRGWRSIWRTGQFLSHDSLRAFYRLGKNEELLGWIYTGSPCDTLTPASRRPPDVSAKLSFAPGVPRTGGDNVPGQACYWT